MQHLNLEGMKAAYLDIIHWFSIENWYDAGFIEASTNQEQSWNRIYPVSGCDYMSTRVGDGFTGISNGWVESIFNLTELVGYSDVRVRFHFVSDSSVVRAGWYIDDVFVSGIPREYWINVKTDKDWYSSNEPIIITANVTRRGTPVTGASVTAQIINPIGKIFLSMTLYDNCTNGDESPNDGIYTNVFTGLEAGNLTGTYNIIVQAIIVDHGVERGETKFTFIADSNLLVRVLNTLNEPAPYVYLNVLDQSSGSIVRWMNYADENGIYYTTLPESLYAVMAWSGWNYRHQSSRTDNFFFFDEDLDVSSDVVAVLLNATAGIPVLMQTSNINAEPEEYFYVDFYPVVGGFGLDVAHTNSSGEAVVYATPGIYHVVARRYATPSYYLYKLNVDCTSPRTVAFQPTLTTTSNLTLSLQRVAGNQYGGGWIHPISLPSPFGFGYQDEVIVTPGEWQVWGGYTDIQLQNGYWNYNLGCEPTRIFNLGTPSSSATFSFGGTLQYTLSVGESYDPGDVVPIYWNLTDSFGNIVSRIYEGTQHVSEPTFVDKTGSRKALILNATGIPQPIAYREHLPYLTIRNPEDFPLVNTDVYWWEKPKQYSLSADAVNGIYMAEMSVNTGPWQDIITISNIFAVGEPELNLSTFPLPFTANTRIIIPISDPHGPCGKAHTMDTMGGILIANRLGIEGGAIDTDMDTYSYISTYDYGTAKVTMTDTTSNLIVLASPGVNQVTYYYNDLKDGTGTHLLPVYWDRDGGGDYLHVQPSGNEYRIEHDGATVTADYAVIEIYNDGGRCVLLVYGLGGEGGKAAAKVVANYDQWSLAGRAVVVKYYDGNSDGYLDTIEIVEIVQ